MAQPINDNLSKAFDLLRFPLAVLVVTLHILPVSQAGVWPEEFNGLGHLVYHIVSSVIFSIAMAAVPCFFIMSGYLLIFKINNLTFEIYKDKLRSRFFTLFIPYIVWNIIAVLYLLVTKQIPKFPSISYTFLTPANFPLWFLRNLIVLNIAFPMFLLISKWLKWLGFIVLTACFFGVPFIFYETFNRNYFTILSVYFFYVGVFAGYNKLDFERVPRYIKAIFLLITSTLILYRFDCGQHIAYKLNYIFLAITSICVLLLADELVRHFRIVIIPILSSASFFIYLSHKVGFTYLSKQALFFLPRNNHWTDFVILIICPLFTCIICTLIYKLLSEKAPAFFKPLIGGK